MRRAGASDTGLPCGILRLFGRARYDRIRSGRMRQGFEGQRIGFDLFTAAPARRGQERDRMG